MALTDLGAIGYMPAANAIARCSAENSFKLIALKGLLEHQLNRLKVQKLSDDVIQVMNLMDALYKVMNDGSQELIRAVEQADSPARLVAAVQTLAAAHLETGISTLIAVLGYNNPTAAVAAVEGLTQLGAAAVQPLMEQLDEYNYGARAYAIRALAALADPAQWTS
jgi:urease accessory protein UreF